MSHTRLSATRPLEQLTERFSKMLPKEEEISQAYGTAPFIETGLKISHATKGELKIVCESSKYAQYLMEELRKVRDKNGQGLNCFYADKTENCACFYIAASKRRVGGQNTMVYADQRTFNDEGLKSNQTTPPSYVDKLSDYGVYQSRGDQDGNNQKLSLACPGGIKGRNRIEKLLGLESIDSLGTERAFNTFYFDPTHLPYEVGNQHVIQTQIIINNGLRRSVTECEEKTTEKPSGHQETEADTEAPAQTEEKDTTKTKTYTGDDAKLVLHTAIQMTAPDQFLLLDDKFKSEEPFEREGMFVFDGTAYKQFGWGGSDHETLSLKWVLDRGEMKLAVAYYCYLNCFASSIQKTATYLVSFNETGSAMTTELIDVPETKAISLASTLKQQKDNSWRWEPIKGDVYVPSGGEVIDALTEWAKDINTKKLKIAPIPKPHPEKNSSCGFSEWRKSKNGLEVFLRIQNLYQSGTQSAQELVAELHNTILNSISTSTTGNYTKRLQAVKGIMKILQEAESNPKESTPDHQGQAEEKSGPGPVPIPFTAKQRQDIGTHFHTLLKTTPTWKEKNLISKVMIAIGIIVPIIGWAPLLFWDYHRHNKYKENIRSSAQKAAGIEVKEDASNTYFSERIKPLFRIS